MSIKINNQILVGAVSALILIFVGVMFMHGYSVGSFLYILGCIFISMVIMFAWWRDILLIGFRITKMLFFIVSEIMFFFLPFFGFFQ